MNKEYKIITNLMHTSKYSIIDKLKAIKFKGSILGGLN